MKTFFLKKKQKTEEKKISKLLENFLMKVSGNSHSTETLRSPLRSQNVSFLVKPKEGLR